MLSVDAVAVSVEPDPPYLGEGVMPASASELRDLMREWSSDGPPPDLKTEYVMAVAASAEIPIRQLRMLSSREDGSDVAELALDALGAPPGPQPLLLVQSGVDRDSSTMLLPRLVHERGWHVTEELGVTHLGDHGGTAILELLGWLIDPAVGATVLVVDQPVFVAAARVPDRLSTVALRFGGGDGTLRVLRWGEGSPPDDADHRYTGTGACGGWPDLHAALGRGDFRAGARIALRADTDDRASWCLLRYQAASGDRPTWWQEPVQTGQTTEGAH